MIIPVEFHHFIHIGVDSDCAIWKGDSDWYNNPIYVSFSNRIYVRHELVWVNYNIRLQNEAIRLSCNCYMCVNPDHMFFLTRIK